MAALDVQPQASPNSQFLTRISDLPVVNQTWNYATSTYDKVKGSNPLVNYTLTTAEKSVQFAADQVKPVVHKFEKPIELVDGLACKGLGKIEALAPAIKKTPTEILEDTKQLYNDTIVQRYKGIKNYGTETVSAVKNYGTQKASDLLASPYGQLLTNKVDGALTFTENYMDYYLPPTVEETQQVLEGIQEEKDKPAVRERVGSLSSKMKSRVYANLVQTLQARSQESLSKLSQTLDLIQSVARDTMAARLWEELSKEQHQAEEGGNESLDGRLLLVARALTQQLIHTYQIAAGLTQTLPKDLQERLATARTYTQDLYTQFSQAQVVADLTSSILSQSIQKLHFLEQVFPKTSLKPVENNSTEKSETEAHEVGENSKPTENSQ
jgi:hypothetical protein